VIGEKVRKLVEGKYLEVLGENRKWEKELVALEKSI
jgi:hypothetical protein